MLKTNMPGGCRFILVGLLASLCIAVPAHTNPTKTEPSAMTSIELTLVDDDAIAFATFQSHNQKVVSNRHGIFITYLKAANEQYMAQHWRLARSTDGGKTFTTVYEDAHPTNPPVIETDEEGNIYLVRPDFADDNAYLYRFLAKDGFQKPLISKMPEGSAGKFAMTIDLRRKQLYYLDHTHGRFQVVGLDGVVRLSHVILKPGKNAILQYPHLALDRNGTLYAAWTTSKPVGYHYWDIHAMRSRDAGRTWEKLDGTPLTLPVIADDGGKADRISADDEFEVHSWLSAFMVKDGKLHFAYWTENKPERQRYVRYDIATGKRDVDIQPLFPQRNTKLQNDSGLFASRASAPGSTLYFVSVIEDRTRPACLASDDNGASWYEYAICDQKFNERVYSIGGARELTSDDYIIGTFTDVTPGAKTYYEPKSGKVYFFKIKAGLSRAKTAGAK